MGRKLLLAAGIAAAAYAARRLMSDAPRIEQLPEPLRPAATRARTDLLRVRARVRDAIDAGRAETRAAEAALTAEYRRKAGR